MNKDDIKADDVDSKILEVNQTTGGSDEYNEYLKLAESFDSERQRKLTVSPS